MDSEYVTNLKARKCTTPTDTSTIVEMDPGSRNTFDLSYYSLLVKRRGLFESDAALTMSPVTFSLVKQLLHGSLDEFYYSNVKLSASSAFVGSLLFIFALHDMVRCNWMLFLRIPDYQSYCFL